MLERLQVSQSIWYQGGSERKSKFYPRRRPPLFMAGIDSAIISKIARNISASGSNVYYMHVACNYVIFSIPSRTMVRSARVAPPGRLHALVVPCRRCCWPWAVLRARLGRGLPSRWPISRPGGSCRPRWRRVRPTARSGARPRDFGTPTRVSGRCGRPAASWPDVRLPRVSYARV